MPEQKPYLSPTPDGGLYWGELVEGVLLRRYKRFFADVRLTNGEEVIAHTPNTGSMKGCSEPGRKVWLSRHDDPKRTLKFTLEMIDMPGAVVGVNTGVPNRLVKAAALAGRIPGLPHPATVRSEVRCGDSRLDLMLTPESGPEILIEIKNCTLCECGAASFPDAVTARGARHLEELARLAGEGRRAIIFVLVQRSDAASFSPADDIDPEWGRMLRRVLGQGVELMVHRAEFDLDAIRVGPALPAKL